MAERRSEDVWAPVRGQRAVMLTTSRRDGRTVSTPVGYGTDGSVLYVMTDPGAGKVKRLRHTPTVTLAASTLRGEVKGPPVTAVATRVAGAEAEHGRRRITATNRLAWFFLLRRARRAGRDWAVYAVRRSDDSTTAEHDHIDTIDDTTDAVDTAQPLTTARPHTQETS
ncbi:hypothetical protein GCM10022204_01730 [Microlunatus aurantiacus]|uniref:Pyridoxamine 5'-phosphate oxidase N-terminal domain-containing protein n=1 Tax=Microlunatus aurantiacus TaxID=446786 RepID=A0ABP7CH74_9ACTN